MMKQSYPPEFLKLLKSVEAKRPKIVINHILKHRQITTEELKDIYGYNHPPRAIRDVREQDIPVKTFRITGSDGRKIAVYKLGDPSEVRAAKLSGRTTFSSNLKDALIEKHGAHCNIYLGLSAALLKFLLATSASSEQPDKLTVITRTPKIPNKNFNII